MNLNADCSFSDHPILSPTNPKYVDYFLSDVRRFTLSVQSRRAFLNFGTICAKVCKSDKNLSYFGLNGDKKCWYDKNNVNQKFNNGYGPVVLSMPDWGDEPLFVPHEGFKWFQILWGSQIFTKTQKHL